MMFGKGPDPLVLLQQGKYKEAAKVLELKLQRAPHDLSLKMRLAEAYEGSGRKADAAAIYVAEADADLRGGERAQALGLLKKASRLLPANDDLKVRILKLEGQPEASSDQSFSFDIDMSSPDGAPAAEEAGASPTESDSDVVEPVTDEPVVEVEVVEEAPEPAAEEAIGLGPAAGEPPAQTPTEEIPAPDSAEPASVEAAIEVEAADPGPSEVEVPVETVEASEVGAEILEVDASALIVEPAAVAEPAEEPAPESPRDVLSRLFPELGAPHLDLLEGVCREGWVTGGKVLIREEEAGDSMFVVTSGRLEARGHFDGRELLLATFGPGDVIGEVAFLNRVPRTATVRAVEDSTYVELPGEEVRAQLAAVPEALRLLETLLEQRVEKTLQLLKKAERQDDGDTQG